MLCHKILKEMVSQDVAIADRAFVEEVVSKERQWRMMPLEMVKV